VLFRSRALLEAVGTRTIVCEDGELRSHPSGWAEYQRRRDEEREAAAPAKRAGKGGKRQRPELVAQRAARRASRLAEKVEAAEAELREVEDELSDPTTWSTPDKSERANRRHAAAKRRVAELYEEWEEAERTVSAAADPA